jgi:diguanylate cyclase (GGDEF)-like protein/PAS domain S-box-containing protein
LSKSDRGVRPGPGGAGPAGEDWYRDLVENGAELILTHDLAGRILTANRALAASLGRAGPSEIVGRNIVEFLAPEVRALYPPYVESIRRSSVAYGFAKVVTRSGERRILEYSNSLRTGGVEEPVVRFMGRDVTDLKRMERAVSRRSRFDRVIASLAAEFLNLDASRIDAAIARTLQLVGEFTEADACFAEIFPEGSSAPELGYEWRRAAGSSVRRGVAPEDPRALWASETLRAGEPVRSAAPPPADERGRGRPFSEDGWKSFFAVPVFLRDSPAIVLAIGSRDHRSWAEDAAPLLATVSELVAGLLRRKRLEEELRDSEARYRRFVEDSVAGVYSGTLSGRILDCNEACARILGFSSRRELLAASRAEPPFTLPDRESVRRRIRGTIRTSSGELSFRRPDGKMVWILESVSLLEDAAASDPACQGTLIDVSEARAAEARLAFQAHHDPLTGLPNRTLANDRLAVMTSQARRTRRHPAVVFLDIDDFRAINELLGRDGGDEVLGGVADRLTGSVREDDTVARIGGDEFVVLLQSVERGEGAVRVAEKIRSALAAPFEARGQRLSVTASTGIAVFPVDGDAPAALLKNAELAAERAREQGPNGIQLCDPQMQIRALERRSLEASLQRALREDEFVVYYQPQVSLRSGRTAGFEALLRWRDPERGLVPPGQFIAFAEETRLILPIGERVLRTALAQAKQWHESGFPELRAAVNLSARQFEQTDLTRLIAEAVRETGFPPDRLELEITESIAMRSAERTQAVFAELRELGAQVAIDDFGTGQASMSYLKRFPVSSLKIDQVFVRDLGVSLADAAIVRAVIALAHGLRLRVVAEGVESEDQRRLLLDWGCDEIQGYLVGRPMPAEDFREFLEKSRGGRR